MDITDICLYCKNFFLKEYEDSIHAGTYTISNGEIETLDFLKIGQYFKINDSDLNDGVYQYTGEPITELTDETFTGSIWAMSVPPAFLKLCKEIDDWRTKYEKSDSKNMAPFSSESVSGVYSYTKSGTSSESSGSLTTWQDAFKSKLNKWRRISIL